ETLRTSRYGANTANASRISVIAALAILRSSVLGWSATNPSASAIRVSDSRTLAVTPRSATSLEIISTSSSGSSASAGRPVGMAGQLYGSRRHGAGVGLLAVFAGLCAGELVVGLVRGSSSPVVPV